MQLQLNNQSITTHAVYKPHSKAVFESIGFGFLPAFMDIKSKETHLSSYKNGKTAAVHILDGLPEDWIAEWGEDGRATTLKFGVVAGFMRAGIFYSLSDIMNNLCDA